MVSKFENYLVLQISANILVFLLSEHSGENRLSHRFSNILTTGPGVKKDTLEADVGLTPSSITSLFCNFGKVTLCYFVKS